MLVPGGREVAIFWLVKELVDCIRLSRGVLSGMMGEEEVATGPGRAMR